MSQPRTVLGRSQEQVHALVQQWQEELRLSDWQIETEIADPRELEDSDANVRFLVDTRFAIIRIASDCENEQELHDSIVHELLHLHFWFANSDDDLRVKIVEQAIHSIAPLMARFYLAAEPKAPQPA